LKKRLDVYLAEQGLAPSRQQAQGIIMSGCVYVNGEQADKPGIRITDDCMVEVRSNACKYVSRGGLKLEKALNYFNIDLNGYVCADIGASTGGFTDCMLQNGAKKVYCVDVGYGQLAWQLRTDSRVVNLERKNIRYLTVEDIPEKTDFATVDVSFISLKLVLPKVYELLGENGLAVALIKPQFEAGRGEVGKKGVIKDAKTHLDVVCKVMTFTGELGFKIYGLTHSPVKGPKGNIEYLMYIGKKGEDIHIDAIDVVEFSHSDLLDK